MYLQSVLFFLEKNGIFKEVAAKYVDNDISQATVCNVLNKYDINMIE